MCNAICRLNLSPPSPSLRVTRCEYTMCSSSRKIRALLKTMVTFPNRKGEVFFRYYAFYAAFVLLMRHHNLSLWDVSSVVHNGIQGNAFPFKNVTVIQFHGQSLFHCSVLTV